MTNRSVVIDTNCLVQIISKKSPFRPVWDAFLNNEYEMCVSNEILDEYQEVLEQLTTTSIAENMIMSLINSRNVKMINPQYRFNLIEKDPDDNKFVDCAITGGADYFVSDDAHFNILKQIQFPHVRVWHLSELLQEFI